MVRNGFAWNYKAYSKSVDFRQLEFGARIEKRGLWADKNAVPPWEWRKHVREIPDSDIDPDESVTTDIDPIE